MTRFARRAAVAVTAIAVALAPVNAAHANDLRDSLNTANQGLQVAQQGVNLLNQASPALSSGSSTSRPSQGGGGNPSTAIGGEYLNNYNLNATMGGREYQFSTYKHGSKASQSWNLDKPYSRLTATLGFDDKHLVAGYKAKVVVRADGIILEGLMRAEAAGDRPQSDLIPKIVRGLLAHRKAGRWGSTQENAFVLLALDRYFRTYEAQTPDFVARAWLGEDYAGAFTFEGRTTEYQNLTVPMAFLVDRVGAEDLILEKDGEGRLYYRLGLRYAPTDLDLEPLDQGFVVERRYEAVDDPADVWQDADGVWHIAAGARVRVRLTMVADNRRYPPGAIGRTTLRRPHRRRRVFHARQTVRPGYDPRQSARLRLAVDALRLPAIRDHQPAGYRSQGS